MRFKNIIVFLILTLILFPLLSTAQDCVDYHNVGDCQIDRQRDFKVYSQSKSISMNLLDTIELNVVFYGQKDYMLSFCAHRKMYPIHFIIEDPETGRILYDNENDKYIESLGVGFDVTKTLRMKVDVLSRKASEEEIENYIGCLGLLIQYKNYEKRKVNLKMQ